MTITLSAPPHAAMTTNAIEKANPAIIAALNGAPASFKAVAFACLNLKNGQMLARLPNGRQWLFGTEGSGPIAHLHIVDYGFAKRCITDGDIGFAEGYMAGEWDSPDLAGLLTFLSDNADRIRRIFRGDMMRRFTHWLSHLKRENTLKGSRENILAHYDLGNAFYAAWLDPTMTYSSARFDAPGQDLSEAQLAKYRAIAHMIDLKPGEHVLEIGCGWGGFAEVAAKEFGARVTGVTLSDEQLAFAQARIQREGLNERVDLRIQDYRVVDGAFDKIASIEMFEAVGEKYWPAYFSKVASVLKPGGRAGLQVITIRDDLFEDYNSRVDFIQRYIFPGGMLPSVGRFKQEVAKAGLKLIDMSAFGLSYADTLARWTERFKSAWSDVQKLGFDERFKRMWLFYLSYCEAGFRSQRTDVVQAALVR
ncbi:MAG: class I SAM-dependent methyltransferase [Caulobacterales bacterium]|jgi:cyclopropane-fatty-acyl-phospholipid synthase